MDIKSSVALTIMEVLSSYGYNRLSRKSYPLGCTLCAWRDTFKVDKEKDKAICYKYDDILKQCPGYKKEINEMSSV